MVKRFHRGDSLFPILYGVPLFPYDEGMQKDPYQSQLFSRIGGRRPDFRGKFRETRPADIAARDVLERLGGRQKSHLVQLWVNWSMVMGADIAALAIPLGSRKSVLLVGGEDTMAMQELSYQVPEMLERANAFMDEDYFDKVELRLLMGKTALDTAVRELDVPETLPRRLLPPRPERLGELMGLFDPESPVAQCYAAYVRMYDAE